MAFGGPQRCRVIYPHDGCVSSGVLSLAPGDVLEVERQAQGDWWTGTRVISDDQTPPTLQTGFFYSKFTVPVGPNKVVAAPRIGNPSQYSVTYRKCGYFSQIQPSNEMSCVICHSLASQPYQTMCCGQTVCLVCAEMQNKNKKPCPHQQCQRAPLRLSIDVRMERKVISLNVYCKNHTQGCDWVGRLGDVTCHLRRDCQLVKVECEQCSMEVLRRDYQEHKSSECQQRAVQCPCCKATTFSRPQAAPAGGWLWPLMGYSEAVQTNPVIDQSYEYLITRHYKVCPDWPMRCPNKCPQDNLTRASLQAHLNVDCPEQVISCQFSEAGCGVRVKRREMEEHLQNSVGQHMADMMSDYIKLKKELNQSEEDYRIVAKELTQCKDGCSAVKEELAQCKEDYHVMAEDLTQCKGDYNAVKKTLSAVNEELKAVQKKLRLSAAGNEESESVQPQPSWNPPPSPGYHQAERLPVAPLTRVAATVVTGYSSY